MKINSRNKELQLLRLRCESLFQNPSAPKRYHLHSLHYPGEGKPLVGDPSNFDEFCFGVVFFEEIDERGVVVLLMSYFILFEHFANLLRLVHTPKVIELFFVVVDSIVVILFLLCHCSLLLKINIY